MFCRRDGARVQKRWEHSALESTGHSPWRWRADGWGGGAPRLAAAQHPKSILLDMASPRKDPDSEKYCAWSVSHQHKSGRSGQQRTRSRPALGKLLASWEERRPGSGRAQGNTAAAGVSSMGLRKHTVDDMTQSRGPAGSGKASQGSNIYVEA